MPVTCQFYWPSTLSLFLSCFLDYITHKVFLLQFYFYFYELNRNFKQFFQLLYVISIFQLFINKNSCSRNANANYGVFVIKSSLSFFEPLVTVLTRSTVIINSVLRGGSIESRSFFLQWEQSNIGDLSDPCIIFYRTSVTCPYACTI